MSCQQALADSVDEPYLGSILRCSGYECNASCHHDKQQYPQDLKQRQPMKRCIIDLDGSHKVQSSHLRNFNTTRTNKEPDTGKRFNRLLPCAFLWKFISTSWGKALEKKEAMGNALALASAA